MILDVKETCCFFVLICNVFSWLEKPRGHQFEAIFIDPPYDTDFQTSFWEHLSQHLAPQGVVVVERSKKRQFDAPAGFDVVWDRCYGKTRLVWLRKEMS